MPKNLDAVKQFLTLSGYHCNTDTSDEKKSDSEVDDYSTMIENEDRSALISWSSDVGRCVIFRYPDSLSLQCVSLSYIYLFILFLRPSFDPCLRLGSISFSSFLLYLADFFYTFSLFAEIV